MIENQKVRAVDVNPKLKILPFNSYIKTSWGLLTLKVTEIDMSHLDRKGIIFELTAQIQRHNKENINYTKVQ